MSGRQLDINGFFWLRNGSLVDLQNLCFIKFLSIRKVSSDSAPVIGIPIEPRKAIVVPSLLVVFLSTNEILQGHSKEEVLNRFDRDYIDILVKNWSIWTPVQLANFYFIPLIYRDRIKIIEL